ncbi:keratin-associated protein 21-1-like isoform X2 [Lagopus muta]|nr:keratin-associated protein 21-1-like isoform X2 [Lagopus muta]
MTFYYQNQCDDSCYSPCSYGSVYSYRTYDCGSPCTYRTYDCGSPCTYRTYDCGSPCTYRGSGVLSGYRDCYPSYSSRCYSPCSTRYTRRYSFGSFYPYYNC